MAAALASLHALLPRDGTGDNFSGIPEHRTRSQNYPTLLVSWWCTGFALAFILARLWGRAERVGKLFVEDKIMALSIIPLLIRMAFVHPILLFGTNNSQIENITPTEEYHRSIGARLVLCSRIFYALFIWTAKWTVSEYLKRITSSIWTSRHQFILHCIRIFLVITFIGVVIGTLSECQPFDHYWQVVPDPGPQCRNGYAQLLIMGISDIITDIVLIAFPIHLVITSSMTLKRKIGLSILFSFSVFLIAITAYRMPTIILAKGRQQLRTLWASIEILAAAAVSNALVLGSFVRDKGVKRAKYRGARSATRTRAESSVNGTQPSINREMTKQHWGNDSDENLFRSARGRLDSVADTVVSNDQMPTYIRPVWSSTTYTNSQMPEEEERGEDAEDIEDQISNESPRGTRHDHDIAISSPVLARREPGLDLSGNEKRSQSPTFKDVGGLLHYSPPPTARANKTETPSDTTLSASSEGRDWYAFHRPRRQQPTPAVEWPLPDSNPQFLEGGTVIDVSIPAAAAHMSENLNIHDPGGLLSPTQPQQSEDRNAKSLTPMSTPPVRSSRSFWSRSASQREHSGSQRRKSRADPDQADLLRISDPGGLLSK